MQFIPDSIPAREDVASKPADGPDVAAACRVPKSVYIGLTCCLVLLAGMVTASIIGQVRTNSEFRAVEQSQLVQIKAMDVLSQVQNCTLASRGLVITNDERYFAALQDSESALLSELAELNDAVAGVEAQSQSARRLTELAHHYTGYLNRVAALCQSGEAQVAVELVRSGAGQEMVNEARALVQDICTRQRALTHQSAQAGARLSRWTSVTLASGAILIVVTGILLILHLRSFAQHRRESELAIRNSEDRFARAVRGSTDGLWDWDVATDQVWYSPRFREMLGYTEEEFPDRLESWREHLHPLDKEKTVNALFEHVASGTRYDVDYRLKTRDGSYRWFRARGTGERDECGRATRVAGSIQDITALKQAQSELQSASAELARSNQDLEDFAYVASHDLRAPLRAIRNLVEWMEEDLRDSLNDENRERMELILNRVQRLDGLIEDLLNYSRAGRVLGKVRIVDTNDLLSEIRQLLGPPEGFEILATSPLPVLETFAAPLQRVLQNLIQNAIKHHDRPSGRVELSATDLGRFFEFCVTDDGPGIPPAFQQRVFGLFETLKPRDAVEGSGMGLAVVKRTVEKLGGVIQLQSNGTRGCKFQFTWPKAVKAETAGEAPEADARDVESSIQTRELCEIT